MASLNKDTREFIGERLPLIRKERLMTLRVNFHNMKPRPKRQYWIPTCMNYLTLIITNGVDYDYMLNILKMFKPSIILNIELENFIDEEVSAEKFMELLGYYQINEVSLAKCSLQVRSSSNYLLGPAKSLRAQNSSFRFLRQDQILSCEYMKLESCKLHIKHSTDKLFINVKRAYMANCCLKEQYLNLFSDQLQELVIKKTVSSASLIYKQDILKKIIQEGHNFRQSLKLLSLTGAVSEDSLMALLTSQKLFPNLEVIKIKCDQLLVSYTRIKNRACLKHLKRLDLSGCLVKTDLSASHVTSGARMANVRKGVRMGNQNSQVRAHQMKKERMDIKKKALGKNYNRVKWMDSPDSSEEEEARKKWQESSQESDQSDELDKVRKRFKASHGPGQGFNFDRDFKC